MDVDSGESGNFSEEVDDGEKSRERRRGDERLTRRNRPRRGGNNPNGTPNASRGGRRRTTQANARNGTRDREEDEEEGDTINSSGSSSSSSSSSDDSMSRSPTPPPPPPNGMNQQQPQNAQTPSWDAIKEELYSLSDLERKIRVENFFNNRIDQDLDRVPLRRDPLVGHRLKPEDLVQTPEEIDEFCNLPADQAWDSLLSQFNVLATLKEIPKQEERAQLDFFYYVWQLSDITNKYPSAPNNRIQSAFLSETLSKLGELVWQFYLSIRIERLTHSTIWWLSVLSLHKVAIEKLPGVHRQLLDIYYTSTINDFIKKSKPIRKMLNNEAEKQNLHFQGRCWEYMRRACCNGFVGRIPDANIEEASNPLLESTIINSRPSKFVVKEGETLACRSTVEKTSFDNLFQPNLPILHFKFCELPLSAFLLLLTDYANMALFLDHTPSSDTFLLLLWYHFCRLALDGEELRHLLDSNNNLKRKPMQLSRPGPPGTPQFYKPLSGRFLRDMENIFVNHLEKNRTYYTLVDKCIRKTENSDEHLKQQAHDPRNGPYFSSLPVGFFDTVSFPACRQFLPSLKLLQELDGTLTKIFLAKEKIVAGIEPDAAQKAYYPLPVSSVVPPAATESIIRKHGAMATRPSLVLHFKDQKMIPPAAQLTFKHLAVCMTLGFLRPNA